MRRQFHDAVLHDELGIERDAQKTKGVAERMPIIKDVKALLARVKAHLADSSPSVQIRLTFLQAIDFFLYEPQSYASSDYISKIGG